jgi:hypothetical protein
LNSPFLSFSFVPLPVLEIVSTVLIFPFTYMCTQYLHQTHPPTPFPPQRPYFLLLPTPETRAVFPSFVWFC